MVPKLRFKEFCGEWDEKRLGDVYEFKNGLNKEKEFFGKGIPIVNYMDVNKNTHLYKNTIKGRVQLTKKEIENYSAKKGDLFFTRTSETIDEIGYTAVLLDDIEDAVFSGFILRARPKNELIDFKFSGYCFMTREVRKEIIKKSSMTTRALTSGTSLKQVVFYLPSLPEQTKIAHFLCTVDDKIQNQEDKITHLENIKKGFMQKIFSRKIRFKDEEGEEFPEWEEKRIKDILKEVVEKTTILDRYEVISSTSNGIYTQKDYFNRDIASKNNIGYKVLKINQIVLSPQNLWMGNINLNNRFEIGMVSPSYKVFDIVEGNNINFVGYFLRTPKAFYEYKISSEQGASIVRRNLNMDLFNNIKIILPCLKEQEKIADFLLSFDKKIDTEKETLEHLKQLKKGLLQQMFV